MGMAIAEAYAYGKPALASAMGGMPEWIREGQTGWLVPAGDEQALADKIEWIADHTDEVRGLASDCFVAARPFGLERIVGQFKSLYDQVHAGDTAS